MTHAPRADVASGRRAQTVEQLIACAIELIAERGYAAMSVDALCAKAGVAKTGLYWNFRNKQGLLRAVVERVSAEWIGSLKQTAYASGDPIERLERTLQAIKRRMIERPAELRVLLFALLERSSIDPEAHRALKHSLKNARSTLAAGIADATGIEDVETIAELMLAMLQGIFIAYLVDGSVEKLDRQIAAVREAVIVLIHNRVASGSTASVSAQPAPVRKRRPPPSR